MCAFIKSMFAKSKEVCKSVISLCDVLLNAITNFINGIGIRSVSLFLLYLCDSAMNFEVIILLN